MVSDPNRTVAREEPHPAAIIATATSDIRNPR
jgi:hypothetical protein